MKTIEEVVEEIKKSRQEKEDDNLREKEKEEKRERREKETDILLFNWQKMFSAFQDRIVEQITALTENMERKIGQIKFQIPEIKIPKIELPKIEVPEIKSPEVKIPEIKIPEIKVPAVKIPSFPPVKIPEIKVPPLDLSNLVKVIETIKKEIGNIRFPDYPETKIDLSPVIKAIKEIKLPQPEKPEKIDFSAVTEATENVEGAIKGLRFPVPMPVTQIDVNPLRGAFKASAVSVGTTAAALPASNLSNRRSIIVYNNDASAALYVGGSDVSTTNGIPVAAGTFSPPVDAGSSMVLYGIVASGSVNVRVLEMSNDAVGSA